MFLLVLAHPDSPEQRAVKRQWFVCSFYVYILYVFLVKLSHRVSTRPPGVQASIFGACPKPG